MNTTFVFVDILALHRIAYLVLTKKDQRSHWHSTAFSLTRLFHAIIETQWRERESSLQGELHQRE